MHEEIEVNEAQIYQNRLNRGESILLEKAKLFCTRRGFSQCFNKYSDQFVNIFGGEVALKKR